MAQTRKILIADPDLESVRTLSKALRQRGYQVHFAPDGSRALEVAVLRHPDLTLFDDGCRLLDAKTFVQILRTNPRTEDIPVVLTTESFDADKVRGHPRRLSARSRSTSTRSSRGSTTSSAAATRRRSSRATRRRSRASSRSSRSPTCSRSSAMNRRTGRLNLTRGTERGEIHVLEGRPVNARAGVVEGEKALFRLLGWTEGSFAFVPGGAASEGQDLARDGRRAARGDAPGRRVAAAPAAPAPAGRPAPARARRRSPEGPAPGHRPGGRAAPAAAAALRAASTSPRRTISTCSRCSRR